MKDGLEDTVNDIETDMVGGANAKMERDDDDDLEYW